MNRKDQYLGFGALLGTAFIYGTFGILVRALSPYLTGNQMTFIRAFIVAVVVAIVLLRKKTNVFHLNKSDAIKILILSLSFGVTIFLFTYAALIAPLGNITFSFYSTTLIASLVVSIAFFHEGFGRRKAASFILAMASLALFIIPSGVRSIDLGMIFTGIAGVSDVVTNSMRKLLGGKVDKLVIVFYQMLTGAIFGIVLITVTQQFTPTKSLDLMSVIVLLFFALNFFLLSYLTTYGFQHFDLNLGTIILSLEFVVASVVGYFIYHETMTAYQIVASGLLITSIVVMNLPTKNPPSQTRGA